MNLLDSLILGIIQGLTEFLPVSSSAHLVIWQQFLHFSDSSVAFDVCLHLGTLLAVLIYFRKDIIDLLASPFRAGTVPEVRGQRRALVYIAIATIVTGVIGVVLNKTFEAMFAAPRFAASMLLVTGLILLISDKIKPADRTLGKIGLLRSLIIGLGQAVAITPGISRSGTTIATGIFCGLQRETAARFSFLLAIPAIGGAALLELKDIGSLAPEMLLGYAIGFVGAFLSGFAVIRFLIELVKHRKLFYFSIYCWIFGIVALILL